MRDPVLLMVVGCGVLVGLGLVTAAAGAMHRPPGLSDALALLDGERESGRDRHRSAADPRRDDGDLASRLGVLAFTRLRLPLPEATRRTLALQGRSIGDYFAEKMILAALGLTAPLALVAALQGAGQLVSPVPVLLSLAVAALGWAWPGIAVKRGKHKSTADAGGALFTFFDLVVLERLANASAAQAMMSAASLSDIPLYGRLRGSLERARLEQRPPWQELNRLSQELELPQIADMADVMRLDEQGAALADALRARVRELRDAHLMSEKIAAQQVSERMTLWMVVPSMVFGLVFLTPPILKLLGFAA